MRILGIDPALSITGYGIIDEKNSSRYLVDTGIIKTKSQDPLPVRLAAIHRGILKVIKRQKPDCIILEKFYVHYRHPTTAYVLGQARGVVCLLSAQVNLPLYEYAPTRVRKSVLGRGLASKAQVQRMVASLLGLAKVPKYHDITDALALAITHSYIAKSESRLRYKYT